jgi:cell division protease FtsH
MSKRIGTVFFGTEREVFLGRDMGLGAQREYSERIASIIDEEVQRIIANRYSYVEAVLAQHRDVLDRIAEMLLERETLEEMDLLRLVEGLSPVDPAPWDVALFPEDGHVAAASGAVLAGSVTYGGNGNGAHTSPDGVGVRTESTPDEAAPSTGEVANRSGTMLPGALGG